MSWISIIATIRATNNGDSSTAPYRDIEVHALTMGPKWILEEGSEPPEGAGGYRRNPRAKRRRFDLVVRTFTVKESEWDHGHYELLAEALRAKKLYLMSVVKGANPNPRVSRLAADPATAVPFFGTALPLPLEVVHELEEPEDSRFEFRANLSLIAALPTIGVTIT